MLRYNSKSKSLQEPTTTTKRQRHRSQQMFHSCLKYQILWEQQTAISIFIF